MHVCACDGTMKGHICPHVGICKCVAVTGREREDVCECVSVCVRVPHGQVFQRRESFPALLLSGRSNTELC